MHNLIGPNGPRARKICPSRAYIKRLGEVEKFQSGRISATDEHRNLHMNPLRTPALSGG